MAATAPEPSAGSLSDGGTWILGLGFDFGFGFAPGLGFDC
jgi:hypothetical protein